jgi:hypothetical protein
MIPGMLYRLLSKHGSGSALSGKRNGECGERRKAMATTITKMHRRQSTRPAFALVPEHSPAGGEIYPGRLFHPCFKHLASRSDNSCPSWYIQFAKFGFLVLVTRVRSSTSSILLFCLPLSHPEPAVRHSEALEHVFLALIIRNISFCYEFPRLFSGYPFECIQCKTTHWTSNTSPS